MVSVTVYVYAGQIRWKVQAGSARGRSRPCAKEGRVGSNLVLICCPLAAALASLTQTSPHLSSPNPPKTVVTLSCHPLTSRRPSQPRRVRLGCERFLFILIPPLPFLQKEQKIILVKNEIKYTRTSRVLKSISIKKIRV